MNLHESSRKANRLIELAPTQQQSKLTAHQLSKRQNELAQTQQKSKWTAHQLGKEAE
jgi:hypothetical protein